MSLYPGMEIAAESLSFDLRPQQPVCKAGAGACILRGGPETILVLLPIYAFMRLDLHDE